MSAICTGHRISHVGRVVPVRHLHSLPWWGWAILVFFVLNVGLRMDVGIFVPVLIGMVAAAAVGAARRNSDPQGRSHQPLPPQQPPPSHQPPPSQQPLPPVRPTDASNPGWAGGPADDAAPGASPWVRGSGATGSGATGAGSDSGTETGMPRIDVPQYPHGTSPTPATPASPGSPTSGASPSTDPVVSLGQLHLSRGARDLHAAAGSGSATDVERVLAEVDDQAERLLSQLGGTGALPGSGRREFESGLRRLQRDVAAARGEDPPGAKVARVVQAAGGMGQTGRYE